MDATDSVLLEKWIARRDAWAFRELAARHAGMVYGTCRRILGNPADAEDVAQECFIALAQGGGRVRSSPGGWLHALAVRRSLNRLRGERRRARREAQFAADAPGATEPRWSDIEPHVDEAIASLPDELRAAVLACFLESRSQEDFARELGVSQSTVSRRIEKALAEIRAFLGRRGIFAPTVALASLLATEGAEAAPEGLRVALSKLALTGGGGSAVVAAGGKVLFAKAAIAAAVVLIGAAAGLFAIDRWARTVEGPSALPATERLAQRAVPDAVATADAPGVAAAAPGAVVAPKRGGKAGEVTGIVVDLDGRPVAGATVHTRTDPMSFKQTESGRDGRFAIRGLVPGPLVAIAFLRGHGKKMEDVLASQLISAPFGPVDLTSAGLSDIRLEIGPGAAISGKVVDENGKAVPGIGVHAVLPNADVGHFPGAQTDRNGLFRIAGCAPATYNLCVAPEGAGFAINDYAQQVTLARRQEIGGLVLVHAGPAVLAGRVVDEMDQPVAAAQVLCDGGGFNEAKTGSDGSFRFQVTAGETCRLNVMRDGYKSSSTTAQAGDEAVRVVLTRPQPVRVRVVGEDGVPVTAYEIASTTRIVQFENLMHATYVSVADPEGRAEVFPRQEGEATILVRAEGFAEAQRYLASDERAGEVVIRMQRGRDVQGRIVDAAGNGVEGAKVYVGGLPLGDAAKTDDEGYAAVSDASGAFELKDVSPEPQVVAAYHVEHAPKWARLEAGQSSLSMVLGDGGRIEGRITGIEVGELVGVALMRSCPLANYGARAVDGRYALSHVPPGEYDVDFGRRGQAGAGLSASTQRRMRVVIEEGKTVALDCDWSGADAVVEGVVRFEGEPQAGAWIVADVSDGGGNVAQAYGPSGPDGRYRLAHLPAGTITVRANVQSGELHLGRVVTGQTQAGQTLTLDVDVESAPASGGTIAGRVVGAPAGVPVSVLVYRGGTDAPTSPAALMAGQYSPVGGAEYRSDGTFEIRNVETGACTVVAFVTEGAVASREDWIRQTRMGSATLDVGEGEVGGVTLELR